MNLFAGITAVFLVVISILFFRGKGLFLLGNWNALTAEEKKKYDVKKVRRCAGLCVLLAGAATLYLAFDVLAYLAAYAAFIALLILLFLVYVHTKCFIKD